MARAWTSAGEVPADEPMGAGVSGNRSIAVVSDEPLLEELLKLAAAAGCDLERVPDVTAARGRWNTAPLVIVDEAAAEGCRGARLPRRNGVVLVASTEPRSATWEHAVALGAEQVLRLPGGEQWLTEALADVVEGTGKPAGRVLSVLGGRGGAGASVFTAAVGLAALRRGRNALLIDCDPLAGGLDLVLGAENEQGLRWPETRLRSGRVSASALHAALPGRTRGEANLSILSGARDGHAPEPDAVHAVIEAGRRSGDIVVCDLPRDLPRPASVALDLADLVALVVPAEVRACVAARKVAERILDRGARAGVVIRGPSPGGLRAEEVGHAVGLPVLATMSQQSGLARALEHGDFSAGSRGPLASAANQVLDALTTPGSPDHVGDH